MATLQIQLPILPMEYAFELKMDIVPVKNNGKRKISQIRVSAKCRYCNSQPYTDKGRTLSALTKKRNSYMREHLKECARKPNNVRFNYKEK